MPQAKTGGKTVSEKSTKSELWEAYNTVIAEMSGQPKLEFAREKQESGKIAKTIDDLKTKFNNEISLVSEGISTELTKFVEFAEELGKKKNSAIKEIEDKKEALEEEIAKATKLSSETAIEREKNHKREEDEYQYILAQKRRKEEDEYSSIKVAEKAKIAEDRAKIEERKAEIAKMEKDLAAMPATLENAVSEAVKTNSENLTSAHLAEIKELNLIHEHKYQIAELKITELEKKVIEQKTVIDKIEKELSIANREAKEIAVSVIESRGNTIGREASGE